MLKGLLYTIRYDDMRFDIYRDEIKVRNVTKLHTFVTSGLLLSLLYAGMEFAQHDATRFYFAAIFMILYFLALQVLLLFSSPEKHVTLLFYLFEFPLMALAICLGTFWDPGEPSIAFMAFLCLMPLFILDKPWRIGLYITASAAIYAGCCYYAKDEKIFRYDMFNLVFYWLVALGVNYFTLKERIDSVETCARFRDKAEHDLLTGVFNRGGGDEHIRRLLADRIAGAFFILDIDCFKQINDCYGHVAGDQVLVTISDCLTSSFHAEDIVMRMGGDEFAVYAVGLTERGRCKAKLETVRNEIARLLIPCAEGLSVTVSIGCVINLNSFSDYMAIYERCDMCLYTAKKSGKNCCVLA